MLESKHPYFELSEEQKIMVENARKFLEKEIAPYVDDYERAGPVDRDTACMFLKKLSKLGYLSCLIPEEFGGLGLDHLTFGLLLEQLKRVWASLTGIVSITAGTAWTICMHGSDEQKEKYLKGLMEGDIIGCTAVTEPDAGSDVRSIKTRAYLEGDFWVIDGRKTWISNGSIADVAIVLAKTSEKEFSRILVDRRETPFESRNIPKIGLRAYPVAELLFDGVKVPKRNLIGGRGDGFKEVMRSFNIARANLAVGCVGLAQAALEASIKYAKERIQFRKPIGSFQLVQGMLAEMATLVEASRYLAYRTLWLIDRKEDCTYEASLAKYFCSEAAFQVASTAVQLHGAYGLSEEFPVSRYFRDARFYTIPDGTNEIQKLIIGREILGIGAFR